MTLHMEITSGAKLELPDHWLVTLGPSRSLALLAQASEAGLEGLNLVLTVEQPAAKLQVLEEYVNLQLQAVASNYADQNFTLLGRRPYSTEKETFCLLVHSRVEGKTVLACFQIFTIHNTIASALTLTLPLALLDTGFSLSEHIMQTFSPAVRLYHHPFYAKSKDAPS